MEPSALVSEASIDSRRKFLTAAIFGLGGVIGTLLSVPSLIYLFKPRTGDERSEWIDAGELSLVDLTLPREVTFRQNRKDGWRIQSDLQAAWLSRDAKGKMIAFSPSCTHLGCAYHWDVRSAEFNCPCHGSRFAKDGGVLAGPASRPLDRYRVKVIGKRIWLSITESSQG
jgi:menaquinol-cytochrome c reductase iron-sulfur subunit